MRPWTVVLLVDLALLVGLGWGWAWWGREASRLERELVATRAAAAGAGTWRVRGVVRAVLRDRGVVVLTHDAIPGVMPAMTMGFRVEREELARAVAPGDEVEATLRGSAQDPVITALERAR